MRLLLGILAGLDACSLAPRYRPPELEPSAAAYREAQGWKQATPSDSEPRGPWWSSFHDPTLDELESQVTSANQDLKAAFARLQEARAQTRAARAAQFPGAGADADVSRTQASSNSPTYIPHEPPTYNDFLAGVSLSYEIDLFGRVRNTIAGTHAIEQATAGDVAALDLDLHADLAGDYFALRGLDAQQELLDHTVADYQRALSLTEALYRGGMAALSDVQQARAQLEAARTQTEDNRLRRAQAEHVVIEGCGGRRREAQQESVEGQMVKPAPRLGRLFARVRAAPAGIQVLKLEDILQGFDQRQGMNQVR